MEKLRLADEVPVILERFFFRLKVLPGLLPEDARDSVYDMITKKYHQKLSSVEETIRTTAVSRHNASLLGVSDGAPGFLMFFMPRNSMGDPLYFAEVLYRGDVYEFHNRLGPIQRTHSDEEEPEDFFNS